MFQRALAVLLLPLLSVSGMRLLKRDAAPFDPQFPYTNAQDDGLPGQCLFLAPKPTSEVTHGIKLGNGEGGILVPAPGDKGILVNSSQI